MGLETLSYLLWGGLGTVRYCPLYRRPNWGEGIVKGWVSNTMKGASYSLGLGFRVSGLGFRVGG